jgi:SART-1 family
MSPEDELHNVELAEAEKDAKRNELKTKRRDYTGYDDDEFEPGMQGTKRAVLAKYDEDIDGPARTVGSLWTGFFARVTNCFPRTSASGEEDRWGLLNVPLRWIRAPRYPSISPYFRLITPVRSFLLRITQ